MSARYPLSVQIGEAEREVAMRESVYPNEIARGRLKAALAENRIGIMKEIVNTLRALREAELKAKATHD